MYSIRVPSDCATPPLSSVSLVKSEVLEDVKRKRTGSLTLKPDSREAPPPRNRSSPDITELASAHEQPAASIQEEHPEREELADKKVEPVVRLRWL